MKVKQSEKTFKIERYCRVCGGALGKPVIVLPDQPLANNLSNKPDQPVYKYPLYLCLCPVCKHLQLPVVVNPKLLFKNYLYKSSVSPVFVQHFYELAKKIKKMGAKTVFDIGSNDGILINPLAKMSINAVGIDPAENLFLKSEAVQITGYFQDQEIADGLLNYHGQADVITACNSFAHIDDLHGVMANVRRLLKPEGTFIIEVQYLLPLIANNYFDMIYHEHLSYYSIQSLTVLLEKYGMVVTDIEPIGTHGGSIRVYAKRQWFVKSVNKRVSRLRTIESEAGLDNKSTYTKMDRNIDAIKRSVISKISERILWGYGAPAKATVLVYTLGLDDRCFSIFDDNELKQGKYIPGTEMEIMSPDNLAMGLSEGGLMLIFAWNFADSIINKLRKKGYKGEFLIPLPEPKIV